MLGRRRQAALPTEDATKQGVCDKSFSELDGISKELEIGEMVVENGSIGRM